MAEMPSAKYCTIITSGLGTPEEILIQAKEVQPDIVLIKKDKIKLGNREHEVINLIAQEKTNKEIAKILFISQETVNKHVQNILKKLQVGVSGKLLHFISV